MSGKPHKIHLVDNAPPFGKPDVEDIDSSDRMLVSSVKVVSTEVQSNLSMSLEDLKEVSKTDKQYQKLIETIKNQSFAETVSLDKG